MVNILSTIYLSRSIKKHIPKLKRNSVSYFQLLVCFEMFNCTCFSFHVHGRSNNKYCITSTCINIIANNIRSINILTWLAETARLIAMKKWWHTWRIGICVICSTRSLNRSIWNSSAITLKSIWVVWKPKLKRNIFILKI